jgi:SAM-dependent methyltransferase
MRDPMFFDRVASTYDEARPPYPPELYEKLRELGVLRSGSRILEVGAGTGQATGAFVTAGADVVALEPGTRLAARLQERFPRVHTIVSTLEDAELPEGSFDAAVCATAFHWIDPDVGLPKLHRALVPGGVLAVWRTVFGDLDIRTPFRDRVAEITDRRPDAVGARRTLPVEDVMPTVTAGGLFTAVDASTFRWRIDLTSAQVRALFSTFSDWSTDEVEEASRYVDDLGGSVTEHYVTVLFVCRAVDTGVAPDRASPVP